jgi:tripartite-type tricarboxylate transporter receptor subunit TctC
MMETTAMSLVRCLRALLVWMAWGAVLLAGAHAEGFPARPVTIVVPYATGGFTDQLARVIAPALSARWGQPVVVDNRNGGGTTIGTALVARAPGDGHTLLLTGFGFTANPLLMKNLPYDPKALAPVTLVADAPSVLFVANKVPASNLKEFVAYMRSNPGKVVFASSGNGSSPHIGAEMLASMVGVPIVHAAYRGNAPALNDLMGGQVDAMFDSPSSMSFVQAGRMKVIGVASEQPATPNWFHWPRPACPSSPATPAADGSASSCRRRRRPTCSSASTRTCAPCWPSRRCARASRPSAASRGRRPRPNSPPTSTPRHSAGRR